VESLRVFDGGAYWAVDRFGKVFLGVQFLLIFRVNKWIVAVLAVKDFVRHIFCI